MKQLTIRHALNAGKCTFLIVLLAGCATKQEIAPAPAPAPPTKPTVKSVVIDKTTQTLRAYEDGQVVFETNVSTGKGNSTPNGKYRAGVKHLMHRSSLYHNAPMPFSVQVAGNYFIHGYTIVPNYPASHGCIRVPLTGDNPAKQFFDWVKPGTRITVTGHWKPQQNQLAAAQ